MSYETWDLFTIHAQPLPGRPPVGEPAGGGQR